MRERLQKIVAAAGIASRRKAEQLILEGAITVNGRPVLELGSRADPRQDHIRVAGKLIRPEPLEYHLVHKPQGVLCSVSDPLDRPLVTGLVRSRCRLYPVGRLDFQSEGLILLTNDGRLARQLTRAGRVEKVYRVKVRGHPSDEDLNRLREGISVRGERYSRCRIKLLKRSRNSWYEVVLREGKNRQIRRMFESLGHPVMRVRRIAIGPLWLGDLGPGKTRKMTSREVESIRRLCGSGPPEGKPAA